MTGTQRGLTLKQHDAAVDLLSALKPEFFCHGDCIGADLQVATIARSIGEITIVGFPPDKDHKRAFFDSDITRSPAPYLERNHAIVDEADLMICFPKGFNEELRSGTWATIRYAKKTETNMVVIFPDGRMDYTRYQK